MTDGISTFEKAAAAFDAAPGIATPKPAESSPGILVSPKPPERPKVFEPEPQARESVLNRIKQDGDPDIITRDVAIPPETSPEKHLPDFAGYRILARIIEEGLWQCRDKNNRYIYDADKRITNNGRLLEIAKGEIEARTNTRPPPQEFDLPPLETLKATTQKNIEQFISEAKAEDIVSDSVIALTDRLTRPSDIRVVDEGHGGLNFDSRWDSGKFPEEHEPRPEVTLSTSIIRNRMDNYSNAAKELGINLTQEQLMNAAISAVAVHEWSHSLERALETQYLTIARNLPEYDDKQDYWQTIGLASNVIYRGAEKIAVPMLAHTKPQYAEIMHIERFATGFEFEATRISLVATGVSIEDAERFVAKLSRTRNERLEDFKSLRASLQMSDLNLESFMNDTRIALRQAGLNQSYIPGSLEEIGYLDGYSRPQLASMIRHAQAEVSDVQGIKTAVVNTRNK